MTRAPNRQSSAPPPADKIATAPPAEAAPAGPAPAAEPAGMAGWWVVAWLWGFAFLLLLLSEVGGFVVRVVRGLF